MNQTKKAGTVRSASPAGRAKAQGQLPGWTNGLRQLYDEVVDEELPDGIRDLLAQFDKSN